MELTLAVKEQASRLGFSLVGVTTGDPLSHGNVFDDWLIQGRHGEMSYLNTPRSRQCRAHPERILPGCRSVLILGVRYPAPMKASGDSKRSLQGKIASYAWGVDYHKFIPTRLHALVQFIEAQVGHPITHRGYTDTGPILEREIAMRGGLGWIGKNTCLINPHHGSFFLLAEILLGIELEPDQPFVEDRCGTCERCIQACPTGCILPDRTLDARRCISYLTIELKGPIPPELRSLMDGWVFGCDICQQVCPWNHFGTSTVDPAFDRLLVQPDPDLVDELLLSVEEFGHKYRHSPLRRPKHRGYLRNIIVAMGNRGAPELVGSLTDALTSDHEPLVRAHAAWALGRIGNVPARKALQQAASKENDSQVMLEINAAMADNY